jgi:hypothetical protein
MTDSIFLYKVYIRDLRPMPRRRILRIDGHIRESNNKRELILTDSSTGEYANVDILSVNNHAIPDDMKVYLNITGRVVGFAVKCDVMPHHFQYTITP